MKKEQKEIEDAIAWFKLHDVEAYTDEYGGLYVVIYNILHRDINDESIHLLISPSEVSYRADLWKTFKSKEKSNGDI